MAGIKSYPGFYKLKLPNTDTNLGSTQRYLDQEGNILIIFDKLFNHKQAPYNKMITTVYADFEDKVYNTDGGTNNIGANNFTSEIDNTASEVFNKSMYIDENTGTVILGENNSDLHC